MHNLRSSSKKRNSGIISIGDIPWGTHLCQFYKMKTDLLDTLVPYFKAGLENNELCIWVTSDFVTKEDALKAMAKSVPDFSRYMEKGQIELFSHTDWYLKDGNFDLRRTSDIWIEKYERALSGGFAGLRASGNASWINNKRDWDNFIHYEAEANEAIGNTKSLALCTYSLGKCGVTEIIDVIKNHELVVAADTKLGDGSITSWFDVAEHKKAERVKDEFISMISHELKTPLTVIISALSTAKAEKSLTHEEVVDLVVDAASSANKLTHIVDNLLELSRFQSRRFALQIKPSNFYEIVKSIIEELELESDKYHIINDIPPQIPLIKIDRERIKRVLYNLVENAIKYSPKGGKIRIFIRRQRPDLIIGVSDEGIGISSKARSRLFQNFERIDAYKEYSISGLGLGLRVCQILVEAHGGKIWLESEPAKGSTFLFTIPLLK